jgi:hypothetical protein
MTYLVKYTLKAPDGQTKDFSEYWTTRRLKPSATLVAGNWNYILEPGAPRGQLIKFCVLEAVDNPNIRVTIQMEV